MRHIGNFLFIINQYIVTRKVNLLVFVNKPVSLKVAISEFGLSMFMFILLFLFHIQNTIKHPSPCIFQITYYNMVQMIL